MNNDPAEHQEQHTEFRHEVSAKARRRQHARSHPAQPLWSGFSLFGVVGWSVSIPTLLGIALGLWLDHRYTATHSWTLTMLALGLALGCFNAWRWISHEERNIHVDDAEVKKAKNGNESS